MINRATVTKPAACFVPPNGQVRGSKDNNAPLISLGRDSIDGTAWAGALCCALLQSSQYVRPDQIRAAISGPANFLLITNYTVSCWEAL